MYWPESSEVQRQRGAYAPQGGERKEATHGTEAAGRYIRHLPPSMTMLLPVLTADDLQMRRPCRS